MLTVTFERSAIKTVRPDRAFLAAVRDCGGLSGRGAFLTIVELHRADRMSLLLSLYDLTPVRLVKLLYRGILYDVDKNRMHVLKLFPLYPVN
jgi:hypothetical protein